MTVEEDEYPDDMVPQTASSDESPKTESPTPEWMVPARRDDNIGHLAWQLVGPDGGLPDFTVAGPLADAIQEEDPEAAHRFRRAITGMIRDLPNVQPRQLRGWLRQIRRKTIESATHLLYDFNSTAEVLVKAVALANVPAPKLVEETATVRTVLVDVGYRSVGESVRLPDRRRATVIEATNDAGMTRVMLVQPEG